jgi:hypothetical protein
MNDKHKCLICGRPTTNLWRDYWEHLKPYQRGGFQCLRGNMQMSGKFRGFMSCVYLSSPLITTIRFWGNRKMTLDFGPDPMVLHALAIEGEKLKNRQKVGKP